MNWLRYSRLKTKPKIRKDTVTFLCGCILNKGASLYLMLFKLKVIKIKMLEDKAMFLRYWGNDTDMGNGGHVLTYWSSLLL